LLWTFHGLRGCSRECRSGALFDISPACLAAVRLCSGARTSVLQPLFCALGWRMIFLAPGDILGVPMFENALTRARVRECASARTRV
jgi:hypothetical protein